VRNITVQRPAAIINNETNFICQPERHAPSLVNVKFMQAVRIARPTDRELTEASSRKLWGCSGGKFLPNWHDMWVNNGYLQWPRTWAGTSGQGQRWGPEMGCDSSEPGPLFVDSNSRPSCRSSHWECAAMREMERSMVSWQVNKQSNKTIST